MRYWKSSLFFIAALLIQTNILNLFSIFGYTPNLSLALVIAFSFLLRGEMHGFILGTISGILFDIAFSPVIGTTAIPLFVVALFIYVACYTVNNESYINMALFSVLSIIIYYGTSRLILRLAGDPRGILIALKPAIFSGIYTLIVSMLIFSAMLSKRKKNRTDRHKRWLI